MSRQDALGAGERSWAVVVSVLVIILVALPGVRLLLEDEPPDGFPASTYPMFTRDPGREVEVATVVAIQPDGRTERLSPETIAGTDQVIQASVTVSAAVREGRASAERLCREVGERVEGPATVAVVVERHDALAWSEDPSVEPLFRRVVADCEGSA